MAPRVQRSGPQEAEQKLSIFPVPVDRALHRYAAKIPNIGPLFSPWFRIYEKHFISPEQLEGNDGTTLLEGPLYQMKLQDKKKSDEYCLVYKVGDAVHYISIKGSDIKIARSELCSAPKCTNYNHPSAEIWRHAELRHLQNDVPLLTQAEGEHPAKNVVGTEGQIKTLAGYVDINAAQVSATEVERATTHVVKAFNDEPGEDGTQHTDDVVMVKQHKDYYLQRLKLIFVSPATTCCVVPSKSATIDFDGMAAIWEGNQITAHKAMLKLLHRAKVQLRLPRYVEGCLSDLLDNIIKIHENNRISLTASQSAAFAKQMRCSERIWAIMRAMSSNLLVRKDILLRDVNELIGAPYVVASRKSTNLRGNSSVNKAKSKTSSAGPANQDDNNDDNNDDDQDDNDSQDDDDDTPGPGRGGESSERVPAARAKPSRARPRASTNASANDENIDPRLRQTGSQTQNHASPSKRKRPKQDDAGNNGKQPSPLRKSPRLNTQSSPGSDTASSSQAPAWAQQLTRPDDLYFGLSAIEDYNNSQGTNTLASNTTYPGNSAPSGLTNTEQARLDQSLSTTAYAWLPYDQLPSLNNAPVPASHGPEEPITQEDEAGPQTTAGGYATMPWEEFINYEHEAQSDASQ